MQHPEHGVFNTFSFRVRNETWNSLGSIKKYVHIFKKRTKFGLVTESWVQITVNMKVLDFWSEVFRFGVDG